MQPKRGERLVSSATNSASRIALDRAGAAVSLETRDVSRSVYRAAKPRSAIGGIRKLGVALIAMPDPVTGVPGVALLASSIVMKRREPAGLSELAKEARMIRRELESLRI